MNETRITPFLLINRGVFHPITGETSLRIGFLRPSTVQRIIEEQAVFVDIRVIGEFDDPEWIVKSGDDAN